MTISENPLVQQTVIEGNYFELPRWSYAAIEDYEAFYTPGHTTLIRNNNIIGSRKGIEVTNEFEPLVDSNVITFIDSGYNGSIGIRVNGGKRPAVHSNQVLNNSPTKTPYNGVGIFMSSDAEMCDNYVFNMNFGLGFNNNCINSKFVRNVMDSCSYAFVLQFFGVIGDQGDSVTPHDNEWWGSTLWDTYTFGSFGDSSQFYVQNSPGQYPFHPNLNDGDVFPPITFIGGIVGTPPNCISGSQKRGDNTVPPSLGNFRFYHNYDNSTLGRLRWISDYVSLNHAQTHISLPLVGNGGFSIPGIGHLPIEAILAHMRGTTLGKFDEVDEIVGAALSSLSGVDSSLLIQAKDLNHAISCAWYIEDMLKDVNVIYFNNMDGSELSLTEIDRLKDIAALCAPTYGVPVYRARVLLASLDTMRYEDLDCAFNSSKIFTPHPSDSEIVTFELYPNPATDILIVEYSIPLEQQGELEILDNLGVQHYSLNLPEDANKISISTNDLNNGAYVYLFRISGKIHRVGKFVKM